jgi:hypothetical protein
MRGYQQETGILNPVITCTKMCTISLSIYCWISRDLVSISKILNLHKWKYKFFQIIMELVIQLTNITKTLVCKDPKKVTITGRDNMWYMWDHFTVCMVWGHGKLCDLQSRDAYQSSLHGGKCGSTWRITQNQNWRNIRKLEDLGWHTLGCFFSSLASMQGEKSWDWREGPTSNN